jgi:hypothetical protein
MHPACQLFHDAETWNPSEFCELAESERNGRRRKCYDMSKYFCRVDMEAHSIQSKSRIQPDFPAGSVLPRPSIDATPVPVVL